MSTRTMYTMNLGHWHGCSSSTFIVWFHLTTSSLACGRYTKAICCSTPVQYMKLLYQVQEFTAWIIYLEFKASITTNELRYSQGILVFDWLNFLPCGEVVNTNNQVTKTIGLWQRKYVKLVSLLSLLDFSWKVFSFLTTIHIVLSMQQHH